MNIKAIREPSFLRSENEALSKLKSDLIKLDSVSFKNNIKRIDRIIAKNRQRIEDIEEVISSIDNPEVLHMIRLYQSGETWDQVNRKVYDYDSSQACRKRAERYLERIDFE